MRKLLYLISGLFLWSTSATAATIPITGTIRLANGNLLNGRIRFTLSYSLARDFCSNNIIVSQTVEFAVNNGVLPSNARITGNDCLQPGNTTYTTQYFTSTGQAIGQNVFYISGSQFNIGTTTPSVLTTSNIFFGNSSSSVISGSGTQNRLALWTSPTALGTSSVGDDGSNVSLGSLPAITNNAVLYANSSKQIKTTEGAFSWDATNFRLYVGFGPLTGISGNGMVLATGDGGFTVATANSNASTLNMGAVSNTYTSLNSGRVGSGTRLPLAIFTGGAETLRFQTSNNVSIGTTTDNGFKLDVAGTFNVTGTTRFNALTYTWPASHGSGTRVLTNDGAGNLTWAAGGGGGGAITGAFTTNRIPKADSSTDLTDSSISDTAGTVAFTGLASITHNALMFANSSKQLVTDEGNLNWDSTNKNLYVGFGPITDGTFTVSGGLVATGAGGVTVATANTNASTGNFNVVTGQYVSINAGRSSPSGTRLPFALFTGGAETLRAHTSNNVSIGSSTDNGYKLDVNGTMNVVGPTRFNGQTYTWPVSQTAGNCLGTNGGGTLSWVACAGGGGGGPTSTIPELYSGDYDFALQTPGVALTGGVPATVTLIPGPAGVAAGNFYYIAASGTPEVITTTSTTCSSIVTASCTITFTPTNSHSGAWTIRSATAGMREVVHIAVQGQIIVIKPSQQVWAETLIDKAVRITGAAGANASNQATVILPQTAGQTVFRVNGPDGLTLENFTIYFATPQASGHTISLDLSYSGTYQHLTFVNDYDSIYMNPSSLGSGNDRILSNYFSNYQHNAITVFSTTVDQTGPTIMGNTFDGTNPTTSNASIYHLSTGGINVTGNGFHNLGAYAYENVATGSSSQVLLTGNSFDGQTVAGIYIAPTVDFFGYTITGNFIQNFSSTTYTAILINSPTHAIGGTISGNYIQPWLTTSPPGGTTGIVANGTAWTIGDNQIYHAANGIQATSGVNINLGINHMNDVTTANNAIPGTTVLGQIVFGFPHTAYGNFTTSTTGGAIFGKYGVYSASDTTNGSFMGINTDGTTVSDLRSAAVGSGTVLPIGIVVGSTTVGKYATSGTDRTCIYINGGLRLLTLSGSNVTDGGACP